MKANSMKLRTIGLLLGFAGSLGMSVAANAGGVDQSRNQVHKSVVVRYDDLDLDSAAGIKVLYARLTNAATQVCGKSARPSELGLVASERACYQSALNKAIEKVGNQHLQAMHATGSVARRVG